MSGDHANWNNEPAARSSHAAPPSFAKRENRKEAWKNWLFWTLFACAVFLAVWAIVKG